MFAIRAPPPVHFSCFSHHGNTQTDKSSLVLSFLCREAVCEFLFVIEDTHTHRFIDQVGWWRLKV